MNTIVMIDGNYLHNILKFEFSLAKLDYGKLSYHLSGDYDRLLRTIYYDSLPFVGNSADQQKYDNKHKFMKALNHLDKFSVQLGETSYRGPDEKGQPIYVQKQVDCMISIDMVKYVLSGRVNRVVLLAGDSDFIPAIGMVKSEGASVTLFHGRGFHEGLWEACDERFIIDGELINKCVANRG